MQAVAAQVTVGLFVTCLVDLNRPSVGFAAVKLLEDAGCRVDVPTAQTCCGQPAYNSGDVKDTEALARNVIRLFKNYKYVVAPSASCAGMIAKHYPDLFKNDPLMRAEAEELAGRTYELTSFLSDVMNYTPEGVSLETSVTYHDSCSSLREMQVEDQPRKLLGTIEGLTLNEAQDREACCGFGGTFCVKYPEISEEMVDQKIDNLLATDAKLLAAGDLGCLMNIAGRLHRRGEDMKVVHVAEILAGMADGPGIGEADKS